MKKCDKIQGKTGNRRFSVLWKGILTILTLTTILLGMSDSAITTDYLQWEQAQQAICYFEKTPF